ncbi:hypothetical protein BGZ80_000587 [Entomortierella chlamydospora]|uniref:Uncharacterized protein n=1 Tax=Entomortierella chlamydospora TaxID=101097 RepID=A0A9P6MT20_9FUNG|nr:hypothetical protein BGZ80_000587 [Entomortierella chlamydospora]
MSHGDNNVGSQHKLKAGSQVSYPAAVRDGSRDDPTPIPIHTKKCDILFHHEEIPIRMNLQVKSKIPQTLASLTRRKNFGPPRHRRHHFRDVWNNRWIPSSRHPVWKQAGNHFPNPETYQAVCKQELISRGGTKPGKSITDTLLLLLGV